MFIWKYFPSARKVALIDEITNCCCKGEITEQHCFWGRSDSSGSRSFSYIQLISYSATLSYYTTELHYPTTQRAPCLCTKFTIILHHPKLVFTIWYILQRALFYTPCHIKLNGCKFVQNKVHAMKNWPHSRLSSSTKICKTEKCVPAHCAA